MDWPGEWGPPEVDCQIVSFHERGVGEPLEQVLERVDSFPRAGALVKLAVAIDSFAELKLAHQWFQSGPDRMFFPRSSQGRWQWYRLAQAHENPFQFLRLEGGPVLDQPTLWEGIQNRLFSGRPFFALLGNPVEHSRSPLEHLEFCQSRGANFYKIALEREEFSGALDWLQELGLVGAAVTSPHKELAFEICEKSLGGVFETVSREIEKVRKSEKARSCKEVERRESPLNSVNTLVWEARTWRGSNTDIIGLEEFLKNLEDPHPVIWGGGGMLSPLKRLLPGSVALSSRSGKIKWAPEVWTPEAWTLGSWASGDPVPEAFRPRTLIWAAGSRASTPPGEGRPRGGILQNAWPPEAWRPRAVFDLNYSEDSPGREYALKVGADYQGGLPLFASQARAQRAFWQSHWKTCGKIGGGDVGQSDR